MDAPLCGTRVTGQVIQNILSKSTAIDIGDNHVVSVQAEILGDQGYTSTVLRVKLTWSPPKNGHHLPETVVVKVIGSNAIGNLLDESVAERLDQLHSQLHVAHDIECSIYTLPELQDMVPMARCYGSVDNDSKTPGILILEDLKNRGVLLPKTTIWSEGLNSNQLDSLLESLTTLHAWSVNTKVDWKSKIPTIAANPALATFAETFRDMFPEVRKQFPELFQGLDEQKLNQYLTRATYLELFGSDPRTKYNLPLILVHGDVQPLNMLFEKDKNGNDGDEVAALLDWQMSHPGCGVEDIIRITGLCVSTEVRRELKDQILQKYVELFNKKVTNIENQIKLADVENAYNEMFAFNGIMFGCAIAAMGTVAETMTGMTDEERAKAKQSLMEKMADNYKDTIKILGW